MTASPPHPTVENEEERLRSLRSYGILDTPPEASFDEITRLAAQICDTPIALISLIDKDRQWFKSKFGITTSETSRDDAFCAHTIMNPDVVLEVKDAAADPRFARSVLVTGTPHARFYAGAPLMSAEGLALGALCVIDRKPRTLEPEETSALAALGRQVVAQMEMRRHADHLASEIRKREIAEAALREEGEMRKRETSRLLDLAEKSRGALLSVLEDEQRAGKELARTNRALKMLSLCNEALIVAVDEEALLARVCQIAVDPGGHLMAWVGYAQDDERKTLLPMAQAGDHTGYLKEAALTWGEDPRGQGPAGRCIREGKAMVCSDLADPATGFLYVNAASSRGYQSVICLPIKEGSRTFGMLGLYSGKGYELAPDEVRLLQDLAADLAFGISAIRGRVVRAQAEEALMTSLREKEALLKEVHHRVKNNLQVITSLLRIEGRRIDHPVTKTVLEQMQGRIHSMALLHETLYRSGNFAKVDLAAYLGQLANQLFRSQVASPGKVQAHLDLEPVAMTIDHAIPCGLIVNELASNSLKHAFADGRSGDVWIGLRTSADGMNLILSVRDNGPGLPEDFVQKRTRSLGLQLVSDLARQLQGNLEITPGGEARFEVIFPRSRMATIEIPAVSRSSAKA